MTRKSVLDIVQIARLKPYCRIGSWLVLFVVLMNVGLSWLDATPVLAWLPKTVTGTGFLEDSRNRVADAVQEYRQGRVSPDDHLGAFVGISNMREGIELSVINRSAGPNWRFLGVAGAGFGMADVGRYADLVLASDLRPDVVVVGFGLHQVLDTRALPASAATGFLDHLRRGNVRNAALAVRDSTWMYTRHRDVSVTVESAVLDLRARLLGFFGVALSKTEADERSPWREMVRMDWPDHFSAATLTAQEQFFTDLGIFDPEAYDGSSKALSTLMDFVEQFRRERTKVVLVLTPVHSTLQRRIPAKALDLLQQQLRSRFPDDPPPLLDFRQALDDGGLVDLPHLNQKGRQEFSQKLAGALRELLPQGAPLMSNPTRTVSSTPNP